MGIQLFIGAVLITLTIAIQAALIGLIETTFRWFKPWLQKPPRVAKLIFALIFVVLIIMIGVTLSAWIWAGLLLWLDIFDSLEEAIYFSTVNLTTLGYGDIIPQREWRILITLEAANGLIIFGLSTAYLMEFILEIRTIQMRYQDRRQQAVERRKLIKKQVKKQIKKQLRK